ncbi:MAG: DUF6599 family protein [Spirochaetota bacterium]|nr:DUF6599 family protein [Spirochaetota bacterium]
MQIKYIKQNQESIISFFLLSILGIIAVVVIARQSSYDISKFGMISPGGNNNKESLISLGNLKMDTLTARGFKVLLEPEAYNQNTLHEKINGKAPLYLDSGFRLMISQRFMYASSKDIWMEAFIYDMGTIKNAYSVYSRQKRIDTERVANFSKAYWASSALFFIQGRYYIEIIGASISNHLKQGIIETGRNIRSRLKSTGSEEIYELTLFDKDYLIPGSERLFLKDAFGYNKFTNVFSASYRLDDSTTTVFFSIRDSHKEAADLADGYYKFLIDNGGVPLRANDIKGSKIIDIYGSFETISIYRNFVIGVHGADNQRLAERLLRIILGEIKDADQVDGKKRRG